MEKVSRRAGEKVSKWVTSYELRVAGKTRYPLLVTRYSKKGFTLVELLIAILILSGGIFLLLTMFTTGLDGVIANQWRTQATNLAQDLMDEILGKEFYDPAAQPEWGKGATEDVRSKYDDVDDYSAWKSKNPPVDISGDNLTLYNDFTRSVSVAFVSVDDLQTPMGESANTPCKRIIVYVEHSDIATVSLYGLKTKSVY